MTLRDHMASELRRHLLDDDAVGLAQQLEYLPKSGPATTINGHVVGRREVAETETAQTKDEILVVLVGDDPSHEKGGIANPQIGDRLRVLEDADPTPFSYTGQVVARPPGGWRLEFRRRRDQRVGLGQRRR